MKITTRIFLMIVLLTVLTLTGSAVSVQAQTPQSQVPPLVQAATDFLFLAYPDLSERPLNVTINPTGNVVVVSITDAPVEPTARQVVRVPLLGAVIDFTLAGAIQSFAAHGLLVDSTRNEVLAQELFRHPSWTAPDVQLALDQMGARPTTSAPTPPTDLHRWEPFLGGNARARTAVLRLANRQGTSDGPPGRPAWLGEVEATAADGSAAVFEFQYEPFGGRLIAVRRR